MADKEYWAVEKVRVFAPPTKEKSTLLAIAGYSNRLGFGCLTKYETLAYDTGHSVRTIRRHVKNLVSRGELVVWCDLGRRGSSNDFFVTVAAETVAELEARTGVSRRQMKLPLVSTDRSGAVVQNTGFLCPSPRDKMSLPQGQNDPQTSSYHGFNKGNGAFELKTKEEKRAARQRLAENDADAIVEISPETQDIIRAALEGVKPVYRVPQPELVEPEPIKRPFSQQEWMESMKETQKLLADLQNAER